MEAGCRTATQSGEPVQQVRLLQIDRRQFRLRGAKLRFRFRHIEVGDDPALPPILRQFERMAVGFHGVRH